MHITLNGGLIRNAISGAPYFGSVAEAAEAIGCDARTLLSAIKGKPVKQRTAALICKSLGLEPKEFIKLEPTKKASDTETDEENPILTKASKAAFEAADNVISETLQQYDAEEPEEIFKTLVSLIIINAMKISLVDREFSRYFVDEIYKRTNEIHQIWLDDHLDDTLYLNKPPDSDVQSKQN